MKVGAIDGRAVILRDESSRIIAYDVAELSENLFGPAPSEVFERWDAFRPWAAGLELERAQGRAVEPAELGAPVPRPRQVFAIGMNYAEHAREVGAARPTAPVVFTKFSSALTGPVSTVRLPEPGSTDWEVELVVVIGRDATRVAERDALQHVAGFMAGQDLSERTMQFAGDPAQFSLAKSLPGFAPTGPWVTTLDELDEPGDLALSSELNGETVQASRTSDLIFAVPALIAALSATLTLQAGDLLWTGTPSGVGMGRKPARYLAPGDTLVTRIEGLGELKQTFTSPGGPA